MAKKILPLIHELSDLTKYPPHIVSDVIAHYFSDIKAFLNSPSHARYRLPYLGQLHGNIKSVEHYLKFLIKKMREDPSDKLKESFRIFWRYRRMLQKSKELTSYKKRFGTWHWKKKT